MNVNQLALIAPLIILMAIAVFVGLGLKNNRIPMLGLITLVTLVSLLINFLPGPLRIGDLSLDNSVRLGLDLKGGAQVVLEARERRDANGVVIPRLTGDMEAARSIIEQRVGGVGVSEPVVQLQGENRILVELPGVANADDVISLIRETGELEWLDAGDTPLNPGTLICTAKGCPRPEQIARATGQLTPTPGGTPPAVGPETPGPTNTAAPATTAAPTATTVPASPTALAGAGNVGPSPTPYGGKIYPVVVDGTEVDGTKVKVQYDPQTGLPLVAWGLKGAGPQKMADFTTKSIGKYMPIALDKVIISSPVIKGAITGGDGQIEGMTSREANDLVVKLRYGALPVPLDIVQQSTIGGTLGADSIYKSIIAGVVGLLLIMLFMLFYYRLPGLIADVALLIYALIIFAYFRSLPVTLTLAGIAGFILSIGMAVDANVLIFARIREELRTGKTIRTAVEAGFDHAWPSIRDSNFTTLITTAILYWFGSFFGASIIKGFALTLSLGVLISMFTAVLVTRTFLRLIVDLPIAQNRWWFGIDELRQPPARPPADPGTQPLT